MPQAAAGSGSPPVAKELAVSSDAPRPRMGLVLDQTKGGTIKIKGFVSGGSAQQSGKLKEGDELVRVDGRAVTEMTVAQATDLIMNGFQAPHSSAAATPIKPVGQMTPPQGAKKHSGKPCGIGLTILDNPPHIVTYITPDGPAARSHAIEVGDTLVAINKELVADMEMDELVQRVVGEEGSVADLWLERIMPGGQSHNHHEKGDEIRAELSKLEMLLQDGVLDHATYTAGVEKCWRGCHSVRLVRGVAYTGDIEVAMQGEAAQRRQQTAGVVAAPLSETVVLEFYRPSLKKQVIVELPRPENVRPTQQKDLSPSRHPAHASTVSDPAAAAAADPAGAGGAANRDDAGLEKGVVATSNANGTGAPPSPGVTNGAKPAGGGKSPKDAGAAPARTQLAKLSALVQADEEMPSPSHTPYGVVGGGVESTAGVVSEAELSRHAARASAKPGKRSSLEMEQALMASIAQGTTPRRALDTALSGVADAAGERANDNAHRDNADKGVASPASPAADPGEPAVQVVAFVGSGSKIGLGIAQAKVGPAVMVSGLAPGGAAEQCAAIKVGDELLSVDGVGVRDRDIPARCSEEEMLLCCCRLQALEH